MLKKLAETDTATSAATLEYLREKERASEAKRLANKREGYMVGGLINIGIGVALMIFLSEVAESRAVGTVGLIPGLIGVALLISAFLIVPRKAA